MRKLAQSGLLKVRDWKLGVLIQSLVAIPGNAEHQAIWRKVFSLKKRKHIWNMHSFNKLSVYYVLGSLAREE